MKRLLWWKALYIMIYKVLLRATYRVISIAKKHDTNKVVISISRSKELEGNLEYIYSEITKQLPKVKIHLVYGENKMNLKLFREIILLSDAHYLILEDYYLPVYLIKPKKNLKVIQLWHAAGAFKKFGYSTIGTKFGPNIDYLKYVPIHSNYTHVYVSSEKVVDFYAEAFNMSSAAIYPFGVPRIDLFKESNKIHEVKNKIRTDYPDLKRNLINIIIAPTYRAKGSQNESSFNMTDSIIKISKEVNNNVCIIFKAHPYIDIEEIALLQQSKNIVIADSYSINEWMLIADAFITDYSSSIFEFALLKKPLAHFIPDADEYENNRGFYQPIKTISIGEILLNTKQVVEWINARESNEFFDTTKMIDCNFDYTDDISKRIVSHFISI